MAPKGVRILVRCVGGGKFALTHSTAFLLLERGNKAPI